MAAVGRIAALIKAAQPQISNRKSAKVIGVDEKTIRNDRAENSAPWD